MGRVRVHQHVNPLAPYFRFTPNPIVLSDIFADETKPLFLDIGAARGRFILKMAEADASRNFLGLEIREALVDEANRLATEKNLENLAYVFCNAMISIGKLFENVPPGRIQTVTIQFPDPWFKKKHAKRRMVTPDLARDVVNILSSGGTLFIQTDVDFLSEEMFAVFREFPELEEIPTAENPMPFKTEREESVEQRDLPVFRTSFIKK
jgi:tRNA (guanine-N7-)-methyltransferase